MDVLPTLKLPQRLKLILVEAGYASLDELRSTTVEQLHSECGLSQSAAAYVLRQVNDSGQRTRSEEARSSPADSVSASQLQRNSQVTLNFGGDIDNLIGGGLKPGQFLEIAAPPGGGKTVLLRQLIAQAVKQNGPGSVLIIDTENCHQYGGVEIVRLTCLPQFIALVNYLPHMLLQRRNRIKLLVIDTLTSFLRSAAISVSTRTRVLNDLKLAIGQESARSGLCVALSVGMQTDFPGEGHTASGMVPFKGISGHWMPAGKSYKLQAYRSSPVNGGLPYRWVSLLGQTILPPLQFKIVNGLYEDEETDEP